MPTMLADKDFLSEAMTNMNRECMRLNSENAKLRSQLAWWKEQPLTECDSKCEYSKTGNPDGCICGRAKWKMREPK